MSDEIKVIAEEYVDKFVTSDATLIKINDDRHTRMELREVLVSRIRERGLKSIICYTFMNDLYLEKI
jgi:hypothetical protein